MHLFGLEIKKRPKVSKPLKIVTDERKLRKKSKPVKMVNKKFLERMAVTLLTSGGLGLSAIQVGRLERYIIFRLKVGVAIYTNPVIIKSYWQKEAMDEGCLSLPGKKVSILRAKKITIRFMDLENKERTVEIKDELQARVIQHECDHLEGKLITDYEEN